MREACPAGMQEAEDLLRVHALEYQAVRERIFELIAAAEEAQKDRLPARTRTAVVTPFDEKVAELPLNVGWRQIASAEHIEAFVGRSSGLVLAAPLFVDDN